jgi:hypothetical protein
MALSRPPIHVLSALVTIVLDSLWGVLQAGAIIPTLTIPLMIGFSIISFLTCAWCVVCVQRFIDRDSWTTATIKGLIMGVVAAVPFMVTGTTAGILLLSWAGLSGITHLLQNKNSR